MRPKCLNSAVRLIPRAKLFFWDTEWVAKNDSIWLTLWNCPKRNDEKDPAV